MDTLLIERLIDVLKKEAAVYDDILKISRNKTNIIVEGKVSELESMTRLEQSLVLQMARLEDVREKLVDQVAAGLGKKPEELTITELTGLLDKRLADQLITCQHNLKKALVEIKDANELNSKLIRNSLDYIDFSINIMAQTGSAAGNMYGNSGQVSEDRKRNFFDVKL